MVPNHDSNPWPVNRKSDALPTAPLRHLLLSYSSTYNVLICLKVSQMGATMSTYFYFDSRYSQLLSNWIIVRQSIYVLPVQKCQLLVFIAMKRLSDNSPSTSATLCLQSTQTFANVADFEPSILTRTCQTVDTRATLSATDSIDITLGYVTLR